MFKYQIAIRDGKKFPEVGGVMVHNNKNILNATELHTSFFF